MMRTLMAVTALIVVFGSNAEARSHSHHHHYHHRHHRADGRHFHYAVDRERGVDGICAHRSAAIPDHLIILRGRGLTMVRMPEAQPLARSSSGVTMSARSLADRMVNGSSRAAMTVMRFVRGLDHLRVPSLSGMPTARSNDLAPRRRQGVGRDPGFGAGAPFRVAPPLYHRLDGLSGSHPIKKGGSGKAQRYLGMHRW